MHRTVWPIVVAATLVLLLAILATLQYRWIGEVSNAERDRLRASLRTRAAEVADDFDREISHTYSAFQIDSDAFDGDPVGHLSDAYVRAQSGSLVGSLVKSVYLVDARAGQTDTLLQLDPVNRRLSPVEWPEALAKWRRAAERVPPITVNALSPLFLDAVDASIPALVVAMPTVKRLERGAKVGVLPDPAGPTRAVIVWLDQDRLHRRLLDALITRHFGPVDASEYHVTVVSRERPSQVIYATGSRDDVTLQNADVTAGLFALRVDDLSLFSLHVPPPPPGTEEKNAVAITIVRRGGPTEGARVLTAGGGPPGAWTLLIRGKGGSLEALVQQSRRRNVAIGLGILGLLAVSFVFVIGSAQRQRRLARQQMEFVAAVSHELRTPLAVIQSAGENLADGVVAEGDQVRRYGSLIRTEGRRLAGMVERVLEFAGVSSGATLRLSGAVDVHDVIDEAIAAMTGDARDRDVTIHSTTRGRLPAIRGDAVALRSAIQNVVSNAIKYSPVGSSVDVSTTLNDGVVKITVVDRGLGIDPADVPHVFKPFFRGRRAVDAQVRGTGVGLSVVRHVMAAHGGDVRLESVVAGGTTVTLVLPAQAADAGIVAEARTAT